MGLFRVLRTARATLTRAFYLDEVATPASGAVDVTITRQDGTAFQTASIPTPDVNNGYSFTFNGSDSIDELDLTWTATVGGDAIILDQDLIQVVGGFIMGLADIRGIDSKFRGTSGTAQYPTSTLIEKRIEVEDEFERICGQAFVPRYARETLSGTGRRELVLKWPLLRKVISVKVGGTAYSAGVVNAFGADELGILRYEPGWPVGVGNVVVEYEHGQDRYPTGLVRVGKLRLKSLLLTQQSPLPDRAERIATTETGIVMLAVAGQDTTGIPEVDAELARNPSPRPEFG
jgi:hypothetical protein